MGSDDEAMKKIVEDWFNGLAADLCNADVHKFMTSA
jgi:hypothetical protein